MPKPHGTASKSAIPKRCRIENSACAATDEHTKRVRTPRRRVLTRARRQASRYSRTRITPDDRKLEVVIFLAALATGESINGAARLAGLSERRILRWVAFNGFLPVVQSAQSRGQSARRDPLGKEALDASIDLRIALQDRDLQHAADRYAGGDRDRLHEMWMSGELMAIYEREAIANLRRCGKHDLADHYERKMVAAGPPAPVDFVGEELRRLGNATL